MPGKTPSKFKQRIDDLKLRFQRKQKTTSPYAKKGYLHKKGRPNMLNKCGSHR